MRAGDRRVRGVSLVWISAGFAEPARTRSQLPFEARWLAARLFLIIEGPCLSDTSIVYSLRGRTSPRNRGFVVGPYLLPLVLLRAPDTAPWRRLPGAGRGAAHHLAPDGLVPSRRPAARGGAGKGISARAMLGPRHHATTSSMAPGSQPRFAVAGRPAGPARRLLLPPDAPLAPLDGHPPAPGPRPLASAVWAS